MKRLLIWLLLLMLVGSAQAEPLTFQKTFTADSQAESLDFGDVQIKNIDKLIEYLAQFPNLKKVDMFATRIYPASIDKLAAAFPLVEFGWTMRIGDHWVRTDQTAFSTLHGNASPQHDEDDFRYLKYCRNLLALDIGHNAVKDVSFLYDLPKLKVLILACNQIVDITPVGSLTDLQYLELFKNEIEDISPLTACTELLDLNICFNQITDWTATHSLPKLERLWLYNSNNWSEKDPVPEEAIAAIKAALPQCQIDSTSYSTLGGWRDHKRYYVVF
ncbi:MAG: leucine-rich repeat domain-containing protein, partial [Clostridia bacterium]|nr:leucine-rich repeat domain-containing protein [Clostridia bacterium]